MMIDMIEGTLAKALKYVEGDCDDECVDKGKTIDGRVKLFQSQAITQKLAQMR